MNNKNFYKYNCVDIYFSKLKILKVKNFRKKYNLKDDTMNKSELQKVDSYPIYPRDTKIHSDKGFVNTDNGSQGGTHWTCFIIKDNKSNYFDSFGGQPDKFLLKELPKPIIYHNYEIQDIYSKLYGSYRLNFFHLIERMNYYDTILKRYFQ